jgi:hypothetical protein
MFNRRWLLAAGAAALIAVPAVRAQDETPPPEPAPGGEAVALAFKFPQGAVQRFRGDIKMDMSLSMGGGGLGPIPITMKMLMAYTEKVLGSRAGTGTLALKMDTMAMSFNAMGQQGSIKSQNGKVTTSFPGAPGGAGAMGGMPGANAEQFRALTAGKPVVLRRSALGATTGTEALAGLPTQSFGGAGQSVVLLPDHPVRVGESWESSTTIRPGMGGPLPPGVAPAGEVTIQMTHTLKAIQPRNGHRHAIIETVGTTSTGGAAAGGEAPSFNQEIQGTTRFDLDRGAIVGAQYEGMMSMGMTLPSGGPGGADGPAAPGALAGGRMQIDGQLKLTLVEVPAPKAPARPAKRRPARR